MNRIAPMRPPYQKERETVDPVNLAPDLEYLDDVRKLPCAICEAFGEIQRSPTEAHHPIHDRHGNERRPDREAIPLCEGHHRGDLDKSKFAIHRGKKSWRARYGADHGYIAGTQDKVEKMRAASVLARHG